MSYHLLTKLSRDFCTLFECAAYYDVVIRVGMGENVKDFQAHSLILRARSSYFRGCLSGDKLKPEYDKIIVNKSNITSAVFEVILRYLYSGKVDFMNCDGRQTLDLLYAAEELGLAEILECIQRHITQHQTEWMDRNFIEHHRKIFRNDNFKTLQVYYMNKIATSPTSIFDTFDNFNPEILSSLDECGCIKLDEAIWGYIVNWAKLQIPRLGNRVSGWAKNDWDEFKLTLSQCIPWKGVLSLNWNEFHDLLVPCEPFLPSDEFEYALKQQLKKACGSSVKISSPISIQFNDTIINICHATLISSWIDHREEKPYRPVEIPYEFKLIVRGSLHGFLPDIFYERCEGVQRTVVVFKMSKTNALYGGFNPLDWKYDRTTKDSFIFNFDEDKAEITRLNTFAIHKKPGYGPCFGTKDLLSFPQGKRSILWKTNDHSDSLTVLNYEVFQIVEKPRRSNLGSTSHQSNGISHKKR
ncbi:kelch-like protein 17 [Gigaspora margarita]|uniref:Kelch-like protein 17 n=1 Tax=Gigaspora margarita TaxID=4874 RepID=A0A8H3X2C9_GIGMA|nr:kelch-like protein 17 [Gigaspora margarita]